MTSIPNWFATAAGGSAAAISNTPGTMDNMWQVTEHMIETVSGQLSYYDVLDAVSLAIIELGIMVCLVVTFAIYEFAVVITGIMVAIGPIMIVGYLFDYTKSATDRWVGKLISYSVLALLINVTFNIVLNGEKVYMRVVLTQQASGLAALPVEIKVLLELLAFFGMGMFIIISLPLIAAALGGGVGVSPGSAMMNAFANFAAGNGTRATRPRAQPKAAPKVA